MYLTRLSFNIRHTLNDICLKRKCTTDVNIIKSNLSPEFEKVFFFPFIKYIAIFNRLKVYHLIGTSVAIPSSALLEMLNLISENTWLSTSYIGLTGATLLSLASIPFTNVIGFLYISKDNDKIKISSVNYWGKRVDRVVSVNEWIPLFDIPPKTTDAIYLRPQLNDGMKYKLFIKFGHVSNAKKMNEVLE